MSNNIVSSLREACQQNVGLIGAGALTLTGIAAASYYLTGRPEPINPLIDLDEQSIELEGGVRIGSFMKPDTPLMECLYEDVATLYEAFVRGMRVSNNGPCLGTRTGPNKEYEWLSYKEVNDRSLWFGSGLLSEGLKPGTGTFVGIYSINRTEWVVAEQANNMFSFVTVPLYDTIGPDACKYIINQTELTTVICDKPAKAQLLLNDADQMPSLERIILIESISEQNAETAKKHNVKLIQYAEIVKHGKENLQDPVLPKSSDLATICYTSGTTGEPKGAMLSHANIIANVSAIISHVINNMSIGPGDRHISYLPLAHMFERSMHVLIFMQGAQIGFFQGEVKLLTDDIKCLRPTLFPTVPRLLNRMYDKVINGVQGSKMKSLLFSWAIDSKMVEVQDRILRRNSFWDKLIFGKIQNLLGGEIKALITGSAPLSPEVLNFLRCALGCIVLEGYGQTEAAAGIVFNVPGDSLAGECGTPLACNYVKLVDVPEMDYYAADGKGEVCAKGKNIFLGYYKQPERTAEALDEDGWLHTGDIGMWLPNGTLKIIDRKKNIFKLAQGEYIATEKIENIYMRSQFISQCFVEGSSLQAYIMAVVTLDEEYISAWAPNNGFSSSMKDICNVQQVKEIVFQDMLTVGKDGGLKGFEQVKDILLYPEQFSVENDLLTPTFKNKRPVLRKRFQAEINALYEKHSK